MQKIERESKQGNVTDRVRGGWFTAFLILILITNPLAAVMYFSNPEVIMTLYPKASSGLIYFLGGMCSLNVVLAISIWYWKKVAVYAYYGVIALAFLINMYIGIGLLSSLTGLLGGGIMFMFTRHKMQHFT